MPHPRDKTDLTSLLIDALPGGAHAERREVVAVARQQDARRQQRRERGRRVVVGVSVPDGGRPRVKLPQLIRDRDDLDVRQSVLLQHAPQLRGRDAELPGELRQPGDGLGERVVLSRAPSKVGNMCNFAAMHIRPAA